MRREVLLFEGGPLAKTARQSGVDVKVLRKKSRNWRLSSQLVSLWSALRGSDADVVVSNSLKSALLLAVVRPKGKTYIYYLREGLSVDTLTGFKRVIVLKYLLPRFDGFLANSQWTASTIPESLLSKPLRIAYPLSGAKAASEVTAARPSDATKLRVLSLSRLTRWKGVHVLLDAAAILKERGLGDRLEVTIAGADLFDENNYVDEIQKRALELTGIVRLIGHVDDVGPLLAESDLLAVCSLNPEPFGQVIVQAISAGLVVIATNQGGPVEILGDSEAGILIPGGDSHALADELELLISSDGLLEKLSNSDPTAATRFSDESLSAAFDSSVLEILSELGIPASR